LQPSSRFNFLNPKDGYEATNLMFCLDYSELQNLALKHRDNYTHAEPFQHIVIDNFFPENVLDAVLDEFPDPDHEYWGRFESNVQTKLISKEAWNIPSKPTELLAELNSSAFMHFLQTLTGIDGLIPDPHLSGGGLHQIESGGFLKVHADFCWHPVLKLDRRINVLVYLNKDWKKEYGGELQLWDSELKKSKKVLPLFNRMVVFNTTDFSLHGHPDPLTCPPERSRKSMALYYYSNGRPDGEISTERPDENTTLWTERRGEEFGSKNILVKIAKQITPPIILTALRTARDMFR